MSSAMALSDGLCAFINFTYLNFIYFFTCPRRNAVCRRHVGRPAAPLPSLSGHELRPDAIVKLS